MYLFLKHINYRKGHLSLSEVVCVSAKYPALERIQDNIPSIV